MNGKLRFNVEVFATLQNAEEFSKQYGFDAVSSIEYLCALESSKGNMLNVFLISKGITEEDIQSMCQELLEDQKDGAYENSSEIFKDTEEINLDDGHSIVITKELQYYINIAAKIANNEGDGIISNYYILLAIVRDTPGLVTEIFKLFSLDVEASLQEFFGMTSTIVYPEEIQNCLKDISQEILDQGECLIQGRDKEMKEALKILLKQTKRNVILVGEPGVGKTAIVEKLAHLLKTDECPKKLEKMHIIKLDVNSMIAGTRFRGDAEIKFEQLVKFLEWNKNVILFIDEVHTILGAGSCNDSSLDLSNSLKPILARQSARVIGATTNYEYEKYFSQDPALKRRFEKVDVEEPTFDEVPNMISKKVEALKKYHNVSIDKKMIDYIMTLSACLFNNTTKNPDRTLDAIDKAMAQAELEGDSRVTKKIVLESFDVNLNMYKNMPYESRKATAYHEAGHFIVTRYSNKYSKTVKIRAVSILPAEDYLGINVFEPINYVNISDREYYIESIAKSLAGRIAEKRYTGTNSAGASSDLNHATEMAQELITKFGMGKNFKNRVYYEELYNENAQENLNSEIDEIVDEAYKLAERIIKKHEPQLKAVVSGLLKKGILSAEELDKICEKNKKEEATIS